MTQRAGLLRRMLDALVEGRQRSAQRYVDGYFRDHPVAPRRGEKP